MRFIKLTLVSSRYLVKVGFTITKKVEIARETLQESSTVEGEVIVLGAEVAEVVAEVAEVVAEVNIAIASVRFKLVIKLIYIQNLQIRRVSY